MILSIISHPSSIIPVVVIAVVVVSSLTSTTSLASLASFFNLKKTHLYYNLLIDALNILKQNCDAKKIEKDNKRLKCNL